MYTYIDLYAYKEKTIYIWAPVKFIYIWVVAIVTVLAFRGALSLSKVLWKSAYSRSNMKPKSIPKQARKWIEQLFCWFQVLRQHLMFLSCCIHLHAVSSCSFHLHAFSFHCAFISFHVPFIGIHAHSFSFHIPFIFIPMCIHVLSYSLHLHACSFHFAFMSFHVLSKVMEWLYGLAKQPSATNGYR